MCLNLNIFCNLDFRWKRWKFECDMWIFNKSSNNNCIINNFYNYFNFYIVVIGI